MTKTVYIAGRLDKAEKEVADFAGELEARNHFILEKWWEKGPLPKDYLAHANTSSPAARTMVHAAYHSDVMILFPEENILGAAVELGAAIASAYDKLDKKIYVINPYDTRQSVFYAHPAVTALGSLDELRAQEWF